MQKRPLNGSTGYSLALKLTLAKYINVDTVDNFYSNIKLCQSNVWFQAMLNTNLLRVRSWCPFLINIKLITD